ncbi:MAG: hypothetical protein Q4E39_00740 [bacterium]|nr:hypothetical protein [bacterium]
MKCPNCGKMMKREFCMFCGYMINGNYIHNTESAISDLELYLGEEYSKIIRNQNYFITFIFGPLYLCFRGFFFTGFILEIFNCFFLLFITTIGGYLELAFFNLAYVFFVIGFILSKMTWMTINNIIYIKLIERKIKKIKNENGKNYIKVLQNKKATKNIFLPFLAIILYIIILLLIIILYRIFKGNL